MNQSVLLRGVNDNGRALIQLSEALYEQHVLPYYLHLPDKVAGTHHFDVSERRGRATGTADGRRFTRLPGAQTGPGKLPARLPRKF